MKTNSHCPLCRLVDMEVSGRNLYGRSMGSEIFVYIKYTLVSLG